eukprot:tig00000133_g7699.t1
MGKRQRQPAEEPPARTYSLRSRSGSQASAVEAEAQSSAGPVKVKAKRSRPAPGEALEDFAPAPPPREWQLLRTGDGDAEHAARETARLAKLTDLERRARAKGAALVAGVDEAGRGPLAGPVVAAAVILPPDLLIEGVDDSKKLLPEKRAAIYAALRADPRVRIGIGIAEADAIDRDNILQATFSAMREAVRNVGEPRPDHLLVDGPFGIECSATAGGAIPCSAVVKGDSRSLSIAAASICAKEERDRIMEEHARRWPAYGFDVHKGYPTAKHVAAIAQHGPCAIHRMTFAPLKAMKAKP